MSISACVAFRLARRWRPCRWTIRRFDPFFATAAALDVPVMLHPHYVGTRPQLADFYMTNLTGNPLETGIAAEPPDPLRLSGSSSRIEGSPGARRWIHALSNRAAEPRISCVLKRAPRLPRLLPATFAVSVRHHHAREPSVEVPHRAGGFRPREHRHGSALRHGRHPLRPLSVGHRSLPLQTVRRLRPGTPRPSSVWRRIEPPCLRARHPWGGRFSGNRSSWSRLNAARCWFASKRVASADGPQLHPRRPCHGSRHASPCARA